MRAIHRCVILILLGLAPAAGVTTANAQASEPTPPRRAHHSVVYDDRRQQVLLFGGSTPRNGGSSFEFFNDLWAWDGERWTAHPSSGPRLSGQAVAFDAARGVVVSVGGYDGRPHALHRELRDDAWRTTSESTELLLVEGLLVHDQHRNRLVLFGGSQGPNTLPGITREFDGTTWRVAATDGPAGRQAHAMVFDARRGRTVVFGGMGKRPPGQPPIRLGDTWEWDGRRWTRRDSAGPSARFSPGMAYDEKRGVVVLFGGLDSTGFLGDTWTWNGRAWTRVADSGPPPRAMGFMAYDRRRERVVMFGGRTGWPDGDMNDTWEWDGARWRQRGTR